MAEAVEDAFRYDRLVLCACTYDGGIFPPMEDFLHHLKAKAYQNRKIAFVENGSWAPTAARQMKAIVEGFKNIECVEPVVTIKSISMRHLKSRWMSLLQHLPDRIIQVAWIR